MLKKETHTLIRRLCSDFMNPTFAKTANIDELNPKTNSFSQHILPVHDIYLGLAATETVEKLQRNANSVEAEKFLKSCRALLIKAVVQIQERFDFSDPIYETMHCLDPKNAYNLSPRSLSNVINALPQITKFIDKQNVDDEWRSHFMTEGLSIQMSCKEYWEMVFAQKNCAGVSCFPNLKILVSSLLSLPFSNAAVERLFSKLNLTKTSQRSSLKNETICGLLHLVYHLKSVNETSRTMNTSESLLKATRQVKSNATCTECTSQRLQGVST